MWQTAKIGLWHQSDHCSNLSLILCLVGLYNSLDLGSAQFPYLQNGSNHCHYNLALQGCTRGKSLNSSDMCSINCWYYDCGYGYDSRAGPQLLWKPGRASVNSTQGILHRRMTCNLDSEGSCVWEQGQQMKTMTVGKMMWLVFFHTFDLFCFLDLENLTSCMELNYRR